ncbi:MAG: sporulation protein YunB [Bacillaceae bacterium]|nr:sporulation protein YunB [Bacillaceae bacterium]
MDNLIEIKQGENGKIVSVGFNSVTYNRVVQQITQRVQTYLNDINKGRIRDVTVPEGIEVEHGGVANYEEGIIHTIPLGQATGNSLLAHLGPKVPVRFSAIGDVKTQLREEIIPVGINNTYISISVDITVDVRIVIPFATSEEVVETTIPIGMVYIQGEVPEFYNSGAGGMMPAPAIIKQSE